MQHVPGATERRRTRSWTWTENGHGVFCFSNAERPIQSSSVTGIFGLVRTGTQGIQTGFTSPSILNHSATELGPSWEPWPCHSPFRRYSEPQFLTVG